MALWGNTGRPRSKFGKWLDSRGMTQNQLGKITGISEGTIGRVCSSTNPPSEQVKRKIIKTMRDKGYDVEIGDFW